MGTLYSINCPAIADIPKSLGYGLDLLCDELLLVISNSQFASILRVESAESPY
jgi:hypothetical protein